MQSHVLGAARSRAAIAGFGEPDIDIIDQTLVGNVTPTWQEAARVVGYTLVDLKQQFPDLPLGFCVQRINTLVQRGELEAQGKLAFMRLCELRLAPAGA